jgi:hypothetical protein
MNYSKMSEYNMYGNQSRALGRLTHARIAIATVEQEPQAGPIDEGIITIAMTGHWRIGQDITMPACTVLWLKLADAV